MPGLYSTKDWDLDQAQQLNAINELLFLTKNLCQMIYHIKHPSTVGRGLADLLEISLWLKYSFPEMQFSFFLNERHDRKIIQKLTKNFPLMRSYNKMNGESATKDELIPFINQCFVLYNISSHAEPVKSQLNLLSSRPAECQNQRFRSNNIFF